MLTHVVEYRSHTLGADKALRLRQPLTHRQRPQEVDGPDYQERGSPVPVGGNDSGDETSEETSKDGAGDVGGHHRADAFTGKLFADVRDHDRDDAGNENALEK